MSPDTLLHHLRRLCDKELTEEQANDRAVLDTDLRLIKHAFRELDRAMSFGRSGPDAWDKYKDDDTAEMEAEYWRGR